MNWNFVRSIGNSTPAKLSVLMPFVGYLIILNDKSHDFLLGSGAFNGLLNINSLYLFYVGSVLVGVGSIIYYLRCPEIIREFANDRAFVAANKVDIGSIKLLSMCDYLIESKFQDNGRVDTLRAILELNEVSIGADSVIFILNKYYDVSLSERCISILSCSVFYILGIGLIFLPTAISIIKIITIIIGI